MFNPQHIHSDTPVQPHLCVPLSYNTLPTHVHTSTWDQKWQQLCWRAGRMTWNSSVVPVVPSLLSSPPTRNLLLPSGPRALSSISYQHMPSKRESTLPVVPWSKSPESEGLAQALLDEHLVSFLPLILKRDNGLLQSCLTGLLRRLRDKKRRHVLNLTTTHGSGLVMTTGLSSQVMAIETVSSHVHRNVGSQPGQRWTSMAWTTPWLRLLHPSLRWARRSTS